ncbi:reverse transcriptase domain-containing protein [Tanacetum coccineum]
MRTRLSTKAVYLMLHEVDMNRHGVEALILVRKNPNPLLPPRRSQANFKQANSGYRPPRHGLQIKFAPHELDDVRYTKPIGIAEDVFVNVGKFQFPADFVVVDFEPDPRVPLILGRCFLKTSHALIDVYEGEITLRVGKEAITFNLDQTSRYTADYNHMTVNKIDVIDMVV